MAPSVPHSPSRRGSFNQAKDTANYSPAKDKNLATLIGDLPWAIIKWKEPIIPGLDDVEKPPLLTDDNRLGPIPDFLPIHLDPPTIDFLSASSFDMGKQVGSNARMILSLLAIFRGRYRLFNVWPRDYDPEEAKELAFCCLGDIILSHESDDVRAKFSSSDLAMAIRNILSSVKLQPGYEQKLTGVAVYDSLVDYMISFQTLSVRHAHDGPSFWSPQRCPKKRQQVKRNAVFIWMIERLRWRPFPLHLKDSPLGASYKALWLTRSESMGEDRIFQVPHISPLEWVTHGKTCPATTSNTLEIRTNLCFNRPRGPIEIRRSLSQGPIFSIR